MSADYKNTVFLPRTDFPMKAGLPQKEPEILARWEKLGIYRQLRQDSKNRQTFVLHDGPPYANGNLHLGHALNKILKDMVIRSQQMLGKDANYVPGWDCHGLPIEWKIEEKYRAAGKDKDSVDPVEFRQECRDFAAHWIDVQRTEFKRLGIEGDWDNPYTTMKFASEAQIVRELSHFVMNGGLYRGAKPVMWSVEEKTALAEAEVEYKDYTSITIWVRFPVKTTPLPQLEGASVVIWTTTPWTMPGNRAVAFGPDIEYVLVEPTAVEDGHLARVGEKIVLARPLLEQVVKDTGISAWRELATFKGSDLDGVICRHPLHTLGYDFDVPLLAGDFVTTDTGTGFVHCAPGHGEDDWILCKAHGIAVPDTVQADGYYYPHVPAFAGHKVVDKGKDGKYYSPIAKPMIEAMIAAGNLLHHGRVLHSYPHSWRSKAPLIFRNTPQWFISMDTNDLRAKALEAIDQTKFYPPQGRNRIHSMVEGRPDWCVSRQRAWGVPITVFVRKGTGEVLRDQKVQDRIAEAVEAEGADAWYTSPASRFLGEDYKADDFEQVHDILDVWFDSGSTHAFVLEARSDLRSPADLYLEGSDQHRGWFQSSLLESCGTRGHAPYKAILTHGFILDEEKRKMSKSQGNGIEPQAVVDTLGADILRLWVSCSDYADDLNISKKILDSHVDLYRRIRNTFRYLLGALSDFSDSEKVAEADMPELERWVLHRLSELSVLVKTHCESFQFHTLLAELHTFCAVDLSAFYLDIRKDTLYCDAPDSLKRRAARTVMDQLLSSLTRWLAPFLCFTAEEVWQTRYPSENSSVHLKQFPTIPASWADPELAERWNKIRDIRRVVTGALEIERAAKRMGSSLQATPQVYLDDSWRSCLGGVDLAEISITSGLSLVQEEAPADAFRLPDVPGVAVVVTPAEGEKCQRCWKVLPDVGSHSHEGTCGRCNDVLSGTHG